MGAPPLQRVQQLGSASRRFHATPWLSRPRVVIQESLLP